MLRISKPFLLSHLGSMQSLGRPRLPPVRRYATGFNGVRIDFDQQIGLQSHVVDSGSGVVDLPQRS
jgi:hypothetical protein